MTLARRLPAWLLVVLLAAALAAVGMRHTAPSPAQGGIDLSAYVLPDGTLPYICGLDDDGQPKPQGTDAHCPACVNAKAFVDVPALGLPPRALVLVNVAPPRPPSLLLTAVRARAPPARGPPVLLVL